MSGSSERIGPDLGRFDCVAVQPEVQTWVHLGRPWTPTLRDAAAKTVLACHLSIAMRPEEDVVAQSNGITCKHLILPCEANANAAISSGGPKCCRRRLTVANFATPSQWHGHERRMCVSTAGGGVCCGKARRTEQARVLKHIVGRFRNLPFRDGAGQKSTISIARSDPNRRGDALFVVRGAVRDYCCRR